ncbi:interferon-beta production [Mactra antiquata]
MAEASNETPLETEQTDKDSANDVIGPTPGDNESLAPTEDMSIHLSPRDTNKSVDLSPVTPKSAKIMPTPGRKKTNPDKLITVKTKSGPKTSTPRTTTLGRKTVKTSKTNPEDRDSKEKCDMCEETKLMRARCVTCQASMCGDCIDHHRKMKISSTHELQNWDKFLLKIPPTPTPLSPKQQCKIHPDEKLQFYCKVCLLPLCTACKLTKHEGHKTRDLRVEIAEQRENLPFKLSQIRASFLPMLKKQVQDLEEQTKNARRNVKGTAENIEKRARAMKEEIDRTSKTLLEKVKQKEKKDSAKIEERKQAINGYIRSATTVLTSGERIAQNGDDYEVMELYQNLINLSKKMQELTKKKHVKTNYMFTDGQISSAQLEKMFGNYEGKIGKQLEPLAPVKTKGHKTARTIPSLQIFPEVHARLLKTFTCKMVPGNKVSAIAPINDTEAWICFGWTTNEIYLYNKDGFRRKRLQFKQPVDDIAVDKDGNLVVSTFTGSIVRLVDKKLQVRDFFQCPLRCRGLDVSAAGEIIVCGVDMCTAIPSPTKCTIFKFTARGNKTGHLDGDRTRNIPIHPYRVAENIDGSVAVSDWITDKEGRVVVFSHDGKVRMVYYGNTEKRSFLPYGICTDRFGHIIVGDIISQEVHLLDIKGHFLMVLLTKDDLQNERPYSIAVDTMGTLWVGNERAQIKIFRYLLHQSHIVGPYVPIVNSNWNHNPYISPRYAHYDYDGYINYYPYLGAPANTVNHWKRLEPKLPKVKIYKDVPDYWKWRVPY